MDKINHEKRNIFERVRAVWQIRKCPKQIGFGELSFSFAVIPKMESMNLFTG